MEIVYEKGSLSELITGKKVENKEKVVIRYTKVDHKANQHVDNPKITEVCPDQDNAIVEKPSPAKKSKKKVKNKTSTENVPEDKIENVGTNNVESQDDNRKEKISKTVNALPEKIKKNKKAKKHDINKEPTEIVDNNDLSNESKKESVSSEDVTSENQKKGKKKKTKKQVSPERQIDTEIEKNDKSLNENVSSEDTTIIDKKKKDRKEKKDKAKKFKALQEKKEELINNPEELARTVFVGNVPLTAKKIQFKKLFSKYGKVESVRFRCPPIKNINTSKKVSVIKGEYHPERSSWVSYVKFETEEDASKALEANGHIFKDHHLRVSLCKKEEKHDESRAIFIGNLALNAEDDQLWQAFQPCGKIESVRIVRDKSSGIGKGFAYVNFASSDSVQLALQLEDIKINKKIIRIQPCNMKAAKKNKTNSFAKVIKPKKDRKSRHQNGNNTNNKRKREDEANTEGQESNKFKKRKVEKYSQNVKVNTNNSDNTFAGTKIEIKKKKKKDRGLVRKQKLAEKLLVKSK